VPANCARWEHGRDGGDARFNRGGGSGVEAHERIIAIKDDGLDVHVFFQVIFSPRRAKM